MIAISAVMPSKQGRRLIFPTPVVCKCASLAIALASGLSGEAAQDDVTLDAKARTAVIERIGTMVERRYVFPKVASACRADLRKRHEAGEFDVAKDPAQLAKLLTEALRNNSGDQHLFVRARSPNETTDAAADTSAKDQNRQRAKILASSESSG